MEKKYSCFVDISTNTTSTFSLCLGSNLTLLESLTLAHNHGEKYPKLDCSYNHEITINK